MEEENKFFDKLEQESILYFKEQQKRFDLLFDEYIEYLIKTTK